MAMGQLGDKPGQRVVYAFCGAFLAALSAISVQFWWWHIHWGVVGVCALLGFLLALFFGEEAIDLLKSIWWWS
jgi:hypothetical protein